MKIIYVPIDDVIPYERNPRHNDRAVDAVARSIEEFGFRQPIVVTDASSLRCSRHSRRKPSGHGRQL